MNVPHIDRNALYDKNLNFLIGSGASYGLLPTLSLSVRDSASNEQHTLETLASAYDDNLGICCHLFSWYLQEIIKPAAKFDMNAVPSMTDNQKKVVENYRTFLRSILSVITRKGGRKTANIFTTNYDGMFIHAAEDLLRKRTHDFILNDGGAGFRHREFHTRHFGRYSHDLGSFSRHATAIPQINVIQVHGSVYWYKSEASIAISYDLSESTKRVEGVAQLSDKAFFDVLLDKTKTEKHLELAAADLKTSDKQHQKFWDEYKALPVVNPTKWKFHETVFEEHYYEMLRLLSYTLETPDTVFIVFGFSFADEHILNLFRRSLSNPTLKIFLCCFDGKDFARFSATFREFQNVELIKLEECLDFTVFNSKVFAPEFTSGDRS